MVLISQIDVCVGNENIINMETALKRGVMNTRIIIRNRHTVAEPCVEGPDSGARVELTARGDWRACARARSVARSARVG